MRHAAAAHARSLMRLAPATPRHVERSRRRPAIIRAASDERRRNKCRGRRRFHNMLFARSERFSIYAALAADSVKSFECR